MSSSFDHWIDTYQINPSLYGDYAWAAKAKVKQLGTGKIDDYVTLKEHFGKTKDEAMSKAQQEVATWMERQSEKRDR
jgi:hypothetical protein